MQYASFGSISSGTMRTEDLLDTLTSELEHQVQRNAKAWCSDQGRAQRDAYLALAAEANEIDYESEDCDQEAAEETLASLFDALNEFAPPYAYFGAHPGDGLFGFLRLGDRSGSRGAPVEGAGETKVRFGLSARPIPTPG